MFAGNDLEQTELSRAIRDRGNRIRGKLCRVLVSGVSSAGLLPILNEIGHDWKDMFRPALTSLSCEAVGGQPAEADDAGLVLTLASAGFGIHDDIIDRSKHKHFRTTLLGRHGIDTALLIGDLLIVKAWTIVQEMTITNNNPKKIASIFKTYGNLNVEICEAEFMETLCRKRLEINLNYRKQILWKAMAETEACTSIGAIFGNGSNEEVQALAKFGRSLGFIYRLTDEVKDSLNVEGNLPHRIINESLPLPLLFASKASKKRHAIVKSIIEKPAITPSDVNELVRICFEGEAFAYMCNIAKKTEAKAIRNLLLLKPNSARNVLSLMVKRSYDIIAGLPT